MTLFHLGAALLALALASPASAQETGFFRTADGQIVGPDGSPVVLRGVGLGGWLVPEGYMLHIAAPDGGSPRSIRRQIVDLIGEDGADQFFEIYRANYVAEKDIDQIAAWGYDHVRLPFHYLDFWDPDIEAIREDGFAIVDSVLAWCRPHGIGVVLDMHAAPGAQNALNISDSDGVARLWTEPSPYQDWTVAIWRAIAARYADETLILGYDLINEPVLPESVPDTDLRDLYVRLAAAIREVDPNHIIFIEGDDFATDFGVLEPAFDDTMVYAFHKYWNGVGQETIQYLLDLRARTGVPLWLGETGENSNPWFYAVRRLAEANGIGWNWWTHKKVETTSAPASAPFASGYEALVRYWRGQGGRPTEAAARTALFGMAENLDLDRTRENVGVLAALFDDTFGTTAQPFRDLTVPGTVFAVDYDLGDNVVAYVDLDPWTTSGTPGSGNTGGLYRNDGVDIERSTDSEGNGFNVGWTEPTERLQYTVSVEESGVYDVSFRVASAGTGGRLFLLADGASVGSVSVPRTGGWQAWRTVTLSGVELTAGTREVSVSIREGGFNFSLMRFAQSTSTSTEAVPDVPEVDLGPNPTVGPLTVDITLPAQAPVRVNVIDMLGRRVASVDAGSLGPERSSFPLDLSAVPAGLYVVRITAGADVFTRAITVSR